MSRRRGLGRFRGLLRLLLNLGDHPDRTARAYALGVFLSFSPFWGLHTLLGLLIAFLFRLNRLAILVGVYTNNPWTIAPAASLGTALGFMIVGGENRLPPFTETALFSRQFWGRMLSDVHHLLLPFFVGNLILAIVVGLIAYWVLLGILLRRERAKRSTRDEST